MECDSKNCVNVLVIALLMQFNIIRVMVMSDHVKVLWIIFSVLVITRWVVSCEFASNLLLRCVIYHVC